jgi:F0F1-type ATP synthase assembly protein I
MTGKNDDLRSQAKLLGVVTLIPFMLFFAPAIGFFIGGWFDRKFQCYPWVTTILTFLGFVGAGREVFLLLKQVLKESKKSERR